MNGYEERLKKYVDCIEQMAEHAIEDGHATVDRLWEDLQTDAKSHRGNAVGGDLKRIEDEEKQIAEWMTRLSVIRDVKMIMNEELD